MTNQPNSNTNNPVADQNGNLSDQDQSQLDFGIWLENELKCLEERFESFATNKSNRKHYSR